MSSDRRIALPTAPIHAQPCGHPIDGDADRQEVSPGVEYAINRIHRDGNMGQASQWDIPELAECQAFSLAFAAGWLSERVDEEGVILGRTGWGLHVGPNGAEYLGRVRGGGYRAVVAKFVDGTAMHRWHGYPADHQKFASDVPDMFAVKEWSQTGLLPWPKGRKLLKQQRCQL
jgi:hypothetical protein